MGYYFKTQVCSDDDDSRRNKRQLKNQPLNKSIHIPRAVSGGQHIKNTQKRQTGYKLNPKILFQKDGAASTAPSFLNTKAN